MSCLDACCLQLHNANNEAYLLKILCFAAGGPPVFYPGSLCFVLLAKGHWHPWSLPVVSLFNDSPPNVLLQQPRSSRWPFRFKLHYCFLPQTPHNRTPCCMTVLHVIRSLGENSFYIEFIHIFKYVFYSVLPKGKQFSFYLIFTLFCPLYLVADMI